MANFDQIIQKFKGKNILVIGDLILDHYIQGSVSRISQEAPVPIVLQEGDESHIPGGAANVAHNLVSLGANVTIAGQIGADREGQILLNAIKKKKINSSGVFKNSLLPTSLKTRVLAQRQQVLRIDREIIDTKKQEATNHRIINYITKNCNRFDAVIISDYGKGVITPKLVAQVSRLAKQNKIIITADPKEDHFEYYKSVTAITPNRAEAQNAIQNLALKDPKFKIKSSSLNTEAEFNLAGLKLRDHLKLEALLLTLGSNGMRLFEKKKSKASVIKTRAREVFDVSGAGDTVIAVFTLSLTAGATMSEAAEISNIAAGIVVGKMGTVSVRKNELLNAI